MNVEFADTTNPLIKLVLANGVAVAEIAQEGGVWHCHFRAEAEHIVNLDLFKTQHIALEMKRLNLMYMITRRLTT
jgi:hypothetical protein